MKKAFFFLLFFFVIFFSCQNDRRKQKSNLTYDGSELSQGEHLSKRYCQTCHLYPNPTLLDKKTWERNVLPIMGRFLGMYETEVPREDVIIGAIDQNYAESLFPTEAKINKTDWEKIKNFYISLAPDTLPPIDFNKVEFSYLNNYTIQELSNETRNLSVSFVKILESDSNLYIGGIKNGQGKLYVFDKKLRLVDNVNLPSAPTDINGDDSNYLVSLIGTLRLQPRDNKYGQLLNLLKEKNSNQFSSYQEVVVNLLRPVQFEMKDITGNGFKDLIIAEFGFYRGGLYFYNDVNGKARITKNIISNSPGVVKFYIKDMDNDGVDDIVALFAQGDEHISIFYNQGNGSFREQRIIEFPPSYGSVYFELADFDSDGLLDILYCNGDNADYPPILKKYHGVHIYKNNRGNIFEEVFFYPMYGAYKSQAVDLNGSGKLDILAISMFPDFSDSIRRDFVFLENFRDFNFKPKFLKESQPVRWVTFDVTDVNGDGSLDIIIGSTGEAISFYNKKLDNRISNGIYLLISK